VYVGSVGIESVGTVMSTGQMSEIFFMLLMPLFFARLGAKWMLAMGMLAWVVRYGLFAAADAGDVRWMVVAGIVLHGICYDFFFVTGFIYTDERCPPEIRGQAQGMLVLVTQGLGLGLGAQVMGRLVAAFTPEGAEQPVWQNVWLVPAVGALVVLLLFVALFRDRPSPVPSPS